MQANASVTEFAQAQERSDLSRERTHKEEVSLVKQLWPVLVQDAHVAQLPMLRVLVTPSALQFGQSEHWHARVLNVAHNEQMWIVA